MGEITHNEARVLPRQLHLAAERQIIADEYAGTGDNPSRKCFAVGVSQSQHPAIIIVVVAVLDLHQPEVSGAVMAQAVGKSPDGEVVGLNGKGSNPNWNNPKAPG